MRYYESACPVFASTDGVAYELYLSGCRGYCSGCHSPHTHDFDAGKDLNDCNVMNSLISDIKEYHDKGLIDNIVILGGEPLDHDDAEVVQLILNLRRSCPNCKIWLYTHFEIDEVRENHPSVLSMLDWIKCGKYEESLRSEVGFKSELTGVTLATSNQYFVRGGYCNE